MLTPKEEKWVAEKAPWVAERLDALEKMDDARWSIALANHARTTELVADKHAAEADIAAFDREARVYGYFDVAASEASLAAITPDIGRSGLPNSGNVVALDLRVRNAAEKRLAKARAALDKHHLATRMPAGRVAWGNKLDESSKYIGRLATANADVEPFDFTGRPSRKRLADAARAAEAADAERTKVLHSHETLEEARSKGRAAIRATPPMKVSKTDREVARLARVPTLSLMWRDGNSAPSEIDLADMLGWLAGARIEDEVFAQLERQYADFERRGILTMTEADRRRELTRLNRVVHEAELEEAANMLAIIESDRVMIYPPARMSARALLGIL